MFFDLIAGEKSKITLLFCVVVVVVVVSSGTDAKDRRQEKEDTSRVKDSRHESEGRSHMKSSAQEVQRERSKYSTDSRGVKRTSDHLGDHHRDHDHRHSSGSHHTAKRQHTENTSSANRGSAKETKKKSSKLKKEDCWLSANLRVKVVDREYKNGKHYNTKVRESWLLKTFFGGLFCECVGGALFSMSSCLMTLRFCYGSRIFVSTIYIVEKAPLQVYIEAFLRELVSEYGF